MQRNLPSLPFYRIRMLITVFTGTRHWSLSWLTLIKSTPSHSISLTSIPILSSHLRLGFPSCLFHSAFSHHNVVCFSYLPHASYMSRPSYHSWFDHPNNIWWSIRDMKLLIMQSSPISRHFLPLMSKYSPLHPVPEHLELLRRYAVQTSVLSLAVMVLVSLSQKMGYYTLKQAVTT